MAAPAADLSESLPPLQSPHSPNASSLPFPELQELPQKLRGRQRLLQSLTRKTSSPSIARLSTTRSNTYNGNGKGSISCIALNAGTTYGSPGTALSREISVAFQTPAHLQRQRLVFTFQPWMRPLVFVSLLSTMASCLLVFRLRSAPRRNQAPFLESRKWTRITSRGQ